MIRVKKMIATFLLVAFIIVYMLTVMTIAAAKLPGTGFLLQLVFYFIAGMIWIIPAGGIMYWGWKRPKNAE